MTELSAAEAVSLLMAGQLRDGDTVFVGANQQFVQRAVALGRATGLRLRMVAAGGWWLQDPSLADGLATYEPAAVDGYDVPMHQEQAFQDLSRVPLIFVGGLQIDRYGNANLIGIGREGRRWKLRGPGSAGLPTLTGASSAYYAYTLSHDRRSVVAEVEHVSALGRPSRRAELGLPPITRGSVFTPLGRFDWLGDELRLAALAPGRTVDDVMAATSFPLPVSETLETVHEPTPELLAVIRGGSLRSPEGDDA